MSQISYSYTTRAGSCCSHSLFPSQSRSEYRRISGGRTDRRDCFRHGLQPGPMFTYPLLVAPIEPTSFGRTRNPRIFRAPWMIDAHSLWEAITGLLFHWLALRTLPDTVRIGRAKLFAILEVTWLPFLLLKLTLCVREGVTWKANRTFHFIGDCVKGSTPPLKSHTACWPIFTTVIMAYSTFQISLSQDVG